MSFESARAHNLSDDGLVLENGVHIISGAASPQGNINPSVPTFYKQTTDGTSWYHTGVGGINAWSTDIFNVLTGIVFQNAAVLETDSIRTAIGKLQGAATQNVTHNAEAVAETSTTSEVVELTQLTLVTPSLALGNYLLEWSFDRRANGGNKRMYISIRDSGVLVTEHNEHFADAVQISAVTMRKKLTGISGIKTFTLNYRAATNNTTVYMSEALFTLRSMP